MSLSSSPSTEFHRRHSRRNSSSPGGHDLFIISTRTTLNSHLVNYFSNSDINPYCEEQANAGGEEQIRENLRRRAIDESKMYVVVFSEDFPDSEAYLWELETIVEAAKKGGKRILAIFYGVTRDDVSLRTDLYRDKVSQHNADESTVQRWMESLRYAAADQYDDALTANGNGDDDADVCQQTLERVQQVIGPKETSVHLQLNLRGLPNFANTQSLEVFLASSKSSLCIEDCNTLDYLFSEPGRKQVERLKVRRCSMLAEILGLGELECLKVLIIEDCSSLMKLPNLSKLVGLEELCISFCPCITEVLGLGSLESLVRMEISNCENIQYVDINLLKLPKLERFILENCGNLRILGDDGLSFQNLQSPSSQHETINIYGSTLLGRGEPNDRDNADENFQLSETSATPAQSAFVVATHHRALGRNHHYPVFCTGSSSTTANTNEQEIFKEQRCDDSFTNIVLASRSIDVYPYWYPDSGATNHLTNNTSTMIDSSAAPYQGTGKAIVDHEEYTTTISNEDCINHQLGASSDFFTEKYNPAEHTKEQQETFEEQDSSWIFIDCMHSYPSKEEAMAVLRHFFSSGIEMAADHMTSVAAAIQLLLSDKVTSQGDAWKRFSRNVRMAYYYCICIKEVADDEATLHETLLLEASQDKMIGDEQPLKAKIEANHVTLQKAIKNELQAQDFERAAFISQEWLLLVKQQWDLLAAVHL